MRKVGWMAYVFCLSVNALFVFDYEKLYHMIYNNLELIIFEVYLDVCCISTYEVNLNQISFVDGRRFLFACIDNIQVSTAA
jgi:hypothetical protein